MNSATFSSAAWEKKFKATALPGFQGTGLYSAEGSLTRSIGESNYAFVDASWLRNETLGIKDEGDARVGFGRTFVEDKRKKIEAEADMGYTVSVTMEGARATLPTPGASFSYVLHLCPRWTFVQKMESYADLRDKGDWDIRSITKMSYTLSKKAAVFAAYSLQKLTEPNPGYEQTDGRLLYGLRLKF
jgi:hypothetical protein